MTAFYTMPLFSLWFWFAPFWLCIRCLHCCSCYMYYARCCVLCLHEYECVSLVISFSTHLSLFFYISVCSSTFCSCSSSFYECFCSIAFCFLFLFHVFLSDVVDFALVCFIRLLLLFSFFLMFIFILFVLWWFLFYFNFFFFFFCFCFGYAHAIISLIRQYMLTHLSNLMTYYYCCWSVSFHFISSLIS